MTTHSYSPPLHWLNKVPAITLSFWLIKIMSTTVGETAADFLAVNAGLGQLFTTSMMLTFLLLALFLQYRANRYIPWIYWLNVVLVSIVGTQITDVLTDQLGVSLYLSTAAFSILLATIFAIWYGVEKSLSIASIDTRRRETFYWAAILCTFALGTAAGDLATEEFALGFRWGVLVFSALIVLTLIASRFGLNKVLSFWIAYILTRPLGAALGDLLSQSTLYGGLGLGALLTSAAFFSAIIVLVASAQKQMSRI